MTALRAYTSNLGTVKQPSIYMFLVAITPPVYLTLAVGRLIRGPGENRMHEITDNLLLQLGLLLVCGYLAGYLANRIGLPRITGYISAGLFISPAVSGLMNLHQVGALLAPTTHIALSIIAFSIGGSLKISQIRQVGRAIGIITLTQGMGAFAVSLAALSLAALTLEQFQGLQPGMARAMVMVMSAICVATAPAAVLAVMHETRARGPLSSALLGVVVLDDALTLVVFSSAVALSGLAGSSALLTGAVEIGGALVMGCVCGGLMLLLIKPEIREEVLLVILLGLIFLTSGLCTHWHFSALLANMTAGFVVINLRGDEPDLVGRLEGLEEPLYCLFFALAGAHLRVDVFWSSAALGLVLFAGRALGKWGGALLGGAISHAPQKLRSYLGVTLLPQAGLSLGLMLLAQDHFPEAVYDVMLNAMLVSVMLNEFLAPPVVKWALGKAGETQ